jgi:CRP-like cAMP-binding protein
MLLIIEKIIILKSIELFSEISEENLFDLANSLKEVEYESGIEVITQGDLGTSMYIVISGEVEVQIDGKKIVRLGEKEVFGELSALDPEPRAATVITTKPTLLFRIDSTILYYLIAEYPNVAKGIIRILCDRIRNNT